MVAVRGWRLGSVLAIPVQSFFELLDLFEQNPNLLLLETDLFEEKRALRKKKAGDLFRIGPQKMKKSLLIKKGSGRCHAPRIQNSGAKSPWAGSGSDPGLLAPTLPGSAIRGT